MGSLSGTLPLPASGEKIAVKRRVDYRNTAEAALVRRAQAGDQIVARYYDSVALFVRKSSEPPAAGEVAAVQVAPKGAKPAATLVETAEVTATVEAIDYQKRTVTLKGPEGKTRTIKVDPGVKRFKEVKKGDEVVLRFTEAVAISVQKP